MGQDNPDREVYRGLRVLPPFIIRADGRSFHGVAEKSGFKKPFDDHFSRLMAETAADAILHSGLPATAAYTFSDEISIYFKTAPFDGRVEKINSVVASFLASSLTIRLNPRSPVSFDCRIIPAGPADAVVYLTGRQHEAWRNHMNAWCQYLLIAGGLTPGGAAEKLHNVRSSRLHDLAHAHGINLSRTPSWQRRGIMVYREPYGKDGINLKTGEKVRVTRNRMVIDRDLPLFYREEGKVFLEKILSGGTDPDPERNPLDLPVC